MNCSDMNLDKHSHAYQYNSEHTKKYVVDIANVVLTWGFLIGEIVYTCFVVV